jgi:uncharacterized Zn finger protein (UPF0148 family)
MSNRNWVCFSCRITARKPASYQGDVICPQCTKKCSYLGYKIPVPPKSKIKEWQKLRLQLADEARNYERIKFKNDVSSRHLLEQEISKLKSLPANSGRNSLIKQLEKQLG